MGAIEFECDLSDYPIDYFVSVVVGLDHTPTAPPTHTVSKKSPVQDVSARFQKEEKISPTRCHVNELQNAYVSRSFHRWIDDLLKGVDL